MIQIVALFLIGFLVLAVFGRMKRKTLSDGKPKTCKSCGRHMIGAGKCSCGKGV